MDKVQMICGEILHTLETVHERCFKGMTKPVMINAMQYPGVWNETICDSVYYARLEPSKLYLAENEINMMIGYQTEEGQLPCFVWDGNILTDTPPERLIGYSQIQECVSFASNAYAVYTMNHDKVFLERAYDACRKWVGWLRAKRMTRKTGLVELFCGYDTGHDESGRFEGISCPGNYCVNGEGMNAAVLPPEDGITPMIAVDLNCNFFGNLRTLAAMAAELGRPEEAEDWRRQAAEVKAKLFEICYDPEDCFFYDVDKKGNKRKYLSSTIFHLFLEGVLDPMDDRALIDELYERYIGNEKHFNTPYPYPSMSVSDPATKNHPPINCWGYFVQGIMMERCTTWMDRYGFSKDLDHVCRQFVKAWTDAYDTCKLGQELDPITGIPSGHSEWYSSTMLTYLYAARRLGLA